MSLPGNSTINQLLSITHCIYTSFEEFSYRETRAVLLDIFKAFDKVWHEGMLFKNECNGVSGPLLVMIFSYLSNRAHREVLNRKMSKCTFVPSEVPQGSVLGPLVFPYTLTLHRPGFLESSTAGGGGGGFHPPV